MARQMFGEMPEGFKRASVEFGKRLCEVFKEIHKGNPMITVEQELNFVTKGGDPVSAGKKPKPKC